MSFLFLAQLLSKQPHWNPPHLPPTTAAPLPVSGCAPPEGLAGRLVLQPCSEPTAKLPPRDPRCAPPPPYLQVPLQLCQLILQAGVLQGHLLPQAPLKGRLPQGLGQLQVKPARGESHGLSVGHPLQSPMRGPAPELYFTDLGMIFPHIISYTNIHSYILISLPPSPLHPPTYLSIRPPTYLILYIFSF